MGKRTAGFPSLSRKTCVKKYLRFPKKCTRFFGAGYTPKAKPTKACNACSLKELCLPTLLQKKNVSEYLNRAMEEIP